MDIKKLTRIFQPHIVALLGLFALNVLFFSPLVNGKKLKQEDINQFEYITRFNEKSDDKSIVSKYSDNFNGTIDQSLWTDNMLGGMPVYLIHNDDKGNILNDLIPNKWSPIGRMFIFSAIAYAFFLFLSIPTFLSFVGAFAMAFSTNNLILLESGHMTKLAALSYAPLVIMGFIAVFKNRLILGVTLFSVGLSLMLAMNHIQMTYYLFLALIIPYVLEGYNSIKKRTLLPFGKASLGLLVGLLISILSNLNIMWPVYELSKETVRGTTVINNPEKVKEIATSLSNPNMPALKFPDASEQSSDKGGLSYDNAMLWSFGWKDIISAYIPGFVGGSEKEFLPSSSKLAKINVIPNLRVNLYWGTLKSTNGPVYVGAIIVFLAILGLFLPKDMLTKSLAFAILLTIILSFGKYLGFINEFLFEYLPFYNKFRAPNSIWGVTTIFVNVLAIYSVSQFLFSEIGKDIKLKALKNAFYLCGGVALFFLLLGGFFFDFYGSRDPEMIQMGYMQDELFDARKIMQRLDALRSLVLVSLAALLLWFSVNKTLKSNLVIALLVLLIIGDLWQIGKRYIATDKFTSISMIMDVSSPNDYQNSIHTIKELG
jgi:hypothetical protein